MYLTAGRAGVVGSSNFTKKGLGGSDRPNLEINLAISDDDAARRTSALGSTISGRTKI